MNSGVLIASWVVGLIAWAIILDRMAYFSRIRTASRTFAPAVTKLITTNKFDEAIELCNKSCLSHIANVVREGLKSLRSDLGRDAPPAVVKRMERSMTREEEI